MIKRQSFSLLLCSRNKEGNQTASMNRRFCEEFAEDIPLSRQLSFISGRKTCFTNGSKASKGFLGLAYLLVRCLESGGL